MRAVEKARRLAARRRRAVVFMVSNYLRVTVFPKIANCAEFQISLE